MENSLPQKSERQYKDTLFRALFSDDKNFLELYNAVANESLPASTVITPCLSNDLLNKFNDIAACIDDQLIIFFEHQSTISANMPLRLLSYVTEILNLHIVNKDKLYGSSRVMIPTPKFYVLYNGEQKLTDNILKLSDSFRVKQDEPAMELIAEVIDINLSRGETALSRSTTLQSYSYLIEEIRNNQLNGMLRDNAIVAAMDLCINTNILSEFLTEHYQGVLKMLSWEYDADAERRVLDEEAMQRGLQQGIQQGIQQGTQQGAELLVKLVKDGLSLDEALEKVKNSTTTH